MPPALGPSLIPDSEHGDGQVAEIVHDLKNPLSVIGLEVELLEQRAAELGSPDLHRSLERIRRNVAFMTGLVGELLETVMIADGHLALRRYPHALAGLLENAIERIVASCERARIRLEVCDPATADVDATRLERVIENLVQNALKYAPPESPVVVRLEHRGTMACISVIDSGTGLSSDEARTVFDKYRRGKRRDVDGAGLGLYTSRKIVEAHGGRIGVETRAGSGSRFFCELPMTDGSM